MIKYKSSDNFINKAPGYLYNSLAKQTMHFVTLWVIYAWHPIRAHQLTVAASGR